MNGNVYDLRPVQSKPYCDGLDMIKALNQIIGIKFVAGNSCVCVCVWPITRLCGSSLRHIILITKWLHMVVPWLSFHPIKLNLLRIIYLFLSFLWLLSLIENILINFSIFGLLLFFFGKQGDWVYPYRPGDYATLTRKYLGSLYWSTLTLTTIGDLPTPETNAE